ncbi:unnamed protein product [Parajaminaea phylloscopi]
MDDSSQARHTQTRQAKKADRRKQHQQTPQLPHAEAGSTQVASSSSSSLKRRGSNRAQHRPETKPTETRSHRTSSLGEASTSKTPRIKAPPATTSSSASSSAADRTALTDAVERPASSKRRKTSDSHATSSASGESRPSSVKQGKAKATEPDPSDLTLPRRSTRRASLTSSATVTPPNHLKRSLSPDPDEHDVPAPRKASKQSAGTARRTRKHRRSPRASKKSVEKMDLTSLASSKDRSEGGDAEIEDHCESAQRGASAASSVGSSARHTKATANDKEELVGLDEDDDEDNDGDHAGLVDDGEAEVGDDQEDEEDEERLYDDDMDDTFGDGGLGADFASVARLAGYLSGTQNRFKDLLNSLRAYSEPTTQLVALQQLSEALSLANEDTLAGHFAVDSFVKELVYIMGGPKPTTKTAGAASGITIGDHDEEADDDDDDEDAAHAAALAAGDFIDRGEMTLLACRCLANLLEAMPYAAHVIVGVGAIPVLLSKLTEIEFIDLAEQTLQTLEKVSAEMPTSIVSEGGLMAMLQFIDFFNIHIQRTAMTAAANCCRRLTTQQFDKARDVVPIIRNILSYADQRLVESACKCIVRIVESYRHQPELLEQLIDKDLVQALNSLLLYGSPVTGTTAGASASTSIGSSTYTDVLKAFGTGVRASPKLAVILLESQIVETLYHLLTGASAPKEGMTAEHGPAAVNSDGQGVPALHVEHSPPVTSDEAAVAVVGDTAGSSGRQGVAVADMAVLQNLAHRPKEQVQEALALISDLLPPLPRDGVFDSRGYSEKAWHKKRKAAREARNASSTATAAGAESSKEPTRGTTAVQVAPVDNQAHAAESDATQGRTAAPTVAKPERVKSEKELLREQAQMRRIEMLSERKSLVERFTQLVLPTLLEVYAASVALHIRVKALTGLLKIVSFVDAITLGQVLGSVPLASFVASVLSSRDDPTLVLPALQLVELLSKKLPNTYNSLLRREGVMWEIEDIAKQEPTTSKYSSGGASQQSEQGPKGRAEQRSPAAAQASTSALGGPESRLPAALRADMASMAAALQKHDPTPVVTVVSRPSTSTSDPTPTELRDAMIWRSRVLSDVFKKQAIEAKGGAEPAVKALDDVKEHISTLKASAASSTEATATALNSIMALFARPEQPISCFELLRSGLIDGLLDFVTHESTQVPAEARRRLLSNALMTVDDTGLHSRGSSLVRRLQESLNRLENVDIVTVVNGSEDSRRHGGGGVNRQLRLRLQPDGTTAMPSSMTNVIVSIHAIASFERLADFLRPKLAQTGTGADALAARRARLSSMLAALNGGIAGLGGIADTSSGVEPAAASSKATAPSQGKGAPAGDQAATEQSSTTPGPKAPRRSSRLSRRVSGESEQCPSTGKDTAEAAPVEHEAVEADDPTTEAAGDSESLPRAAMSPDDAARQLMDSLLSEVADDDDYEDEEVGDEIWEDEVGPEGLEDTSLAEDKTVNLSVGDDGNKVEVKTPEGTRIPTPSGATSGPGAAVAQPSASSSAGPSASSAADPSAAAGSSSSSKTSYAAALQQKPSDWHIEFSMNGRALPLESTVYSAVHHFETSGTSANAGGTAAGPKNVWNNVYTVTFKKVSGASPQTQEGASPASSPPPVELPQSVSEDSPFAQILRLLRVLYELNGEWQERRSASLDARLETAAPLNTTAFVNNKLTAKLNRQLEEPMIVASKCLPDWSLTLPKGFPFLFPFEARYAFVQLTAFGYNRMLHRWQSLSARNQEPPSNSRSSYEDSSFANLVRLPRAKVRISRDNILPSAFRVMELYGSKDSILEVEYFDEVGTGLGPTLEFYTLASREFARRDLGLWRDDAPSDGSERKFIHALNGLFPAPIDPAQLDSAQTKVRLGSFKILGQFVAKALLDSRIIDCHFSPVFMRAVLGQGGFPSMNTLRSIDAALAASLQQLLVMDRGDLASLGLDFTLPGNDAFELVEGGKAVAVTGDNVQEYVEAVVEASVKRGIQPAVRAFRSGFSSIFPVEAMSTFTAQELVMLFGNSDEDWSEATLLSAIKPDHGYATDSPVFRNLIGLMASFNLEERREFLQWLTGSPKLPIGGFAGLQPQLTVVKRPHEAPLTPDDYLASNMSCANFLKLPQYSSLEVMRKRLQTAVREGAGSFNLS